MQLDEGQRIMNDWFNNLPHEIEEIYTFLNENVQKVQTFDLLSFSSYYNHLHDSEDYSDYRGDKNFFVSEVLALLCLKNDFVNESAILAEDFYELSTSIQEKILNYCGRVDAIEVAKESKRESTISNVSNSLVREAKTIRNPGLPDHHLIFTEKLFEPYNNEVKSLFGFSISDSITIRRVLPELLNKKMKAAIDEAINKAELCVIEVIKFREEKNSILNDDSLLTYEQLEEYSSLSDDENRNGFQGFFLSELFFSLSKIYTFTEQELSDFSNIEITIIRIFLHTFSCGFPSLNKNDKIYEPVTILKTKPFLHHNGQYLIPSFPLIIWAIEEFIFDELFKLDKPHFTKSISDIRHDFLLNEAIVCFEKLLPNATFYPPNLFYNFNNVKCETDCLILFDRVLFIIEAKGHRISTRAKKGFLDKTERHLRDIVAKSYEQGIRTLKYIESNDSVKFKAQNVKHIEIKKSDFDDIVIVSLALEPIGNLSMSIKVANDIGYFKDGYFPWIISLYDLVIIADLFENPIMFIHYLKRRHKFLSSSILSIYEELDLVSYFLSNGLYTDNTLKEAEQQGVNWIEFAPDTDSINDYYMYKFGHKSKFTAKPKCYISSDFDSFLLQLNNSNLPHRVKMALRLLEFNSDSIKQFMDAILKIKIGFENDGEIHDVSIGNKLSGGIGITFMTGKNKAELDHKLYFHCMYKQKQQNSNTWIGFGDTSIDSKVFNFQSGFRL